MAKIREIKGEIRKPFKVFNYKGFHVRLYLNSSQNIDASVFKGVDKIASFISIERFSGEQSIKDAISKVKFDIDMEIEYPEWEY